MAALSLVPETKMADVGKLISLGNILARKTTWLVLTTTSTISCLKKITATFGSHESQLTIMKKRKMMW